MTYLCYAYKIINSEDDQIYIGSTKQTLAKRMWGHKISCKKLDNKCKVYEHMREIGFNKFTIIELGRRKVEDRQQQFMFEYEWQEKLSPSLNMQRAYASPEHKANQRNICDKKYRDNHKEEIVENAKQYRETHREEIVLQHKQYNNSHTDHIATISKKYYDTHTDQILASSNEYYKTHKEKILLRRRQTAAKAILDRLYECDNCNKCYGEKSGLKRHRFRCTLSDNED